MSLVLWRSLTGAVLFAGLATPAASQVAQPLGAVARTAAVAGTASTLAPRLAVDGSAARTGWHPGVWTYVTLGALVGAAAGATYGAVRVARSDDPFIPGFAVALSAGYGAVGGGILGGVIFGVTHRSHAPRAVSVSPNGALQPTGADEHCSSRPSTARPINGILPAGGAARS